MSGIANFQTTQWSLVLAAGGDDSHAARAALQALCTAYWYPLYAFIRRQGRTPQDAQDLTQAFLASLLERRSFDRLTPDNGRFRAFLLASLRHFLSNDIDHHRAQKRGAGMAPLPLEFDTAEGRYAHEPADDVTPESLFERRWALTVIDRVMQSLRLEWSGAGKTAEFDVLKPCLVGEMPPGGYADLAQSLGRSEGAVKVSVHRLRRAFQQQLRAHIATTVSRPDDIDDEIRYLIRAIG